MSETGTISGSTVITVRQAYLAMYTYLVGRWEANSRPDFLTTLLGDVDTSLWKGAHLPADALSTGDPATWSDWVGAVASVLDDK